eukprot:gene317-279_t
MSYGWLTESTLYRGQKVAPKLATNDDSDLAALRADLDRRKESARGGPSASGDARGVVGFARGITRAKPRERAADSEESEGEVADPVRRDRRDRPEAGDRASGSKRRRLDEAGSGGSKQGAAALDREVTDEAEALRQKKLAEKAAKYDAMQASARAVTGDGASGVAGSGNLSRIEQEKLLKKA